MGTVGGLREDRRRLEDRKRIEVGLEGGSRNIEGGLKEDCITGGGLDEEGKREDGRMSSRGLKEDWGKREGLE